ncbi:MAG: hypothetical protein ACD_10C00426G0001 [uncultured bacterium]|nr:MAG: hypothetical protein ACD_10C00426G0001 [uncultured bacterium]
MWHRLAAGMIGHALRADDRAFLGLLCGRNRLVAQACQFFQGRERSHHACDRVAVGDGDGGQTQLSRAGDQFFGMRGTFEEGEIRGDAEFNVRGHTNSL